MLPQKNSKEFCIILLCAGEGKRLGDISKNTPKPLITIPKLGQKTILEHTLNQLLKSGLQHFLVVTGHLKEKVEDFIQTLKKTNQKFQSGLHIIDSEDEYKKGPLYSFLSIQKKRKSVHDNHFLYIVIPGDTVFSDKILDEIVDWIAQHDDLVEEHPSLFYRKVGLESFNRLYSKTEQKKKKISVLETKEGPDPQSLKRIKKITLSELSSSTEINQIIPIIALSYSSVNLINDMSKEGDFKTLTELLNYSAGEGNSIFCCEVETKTLFFDIDTKWDLENLGP